MYRHIFGKLLHCGFAFFVASAAGVMFAASALGAEKTYCAPRSGATAVDLSTPSINPDDIDDLEFFNKMNNIGVKTIIRYYSYQDENGEEKTLYMVERDAITKNGFNIAVVFQHYNANYKKFKDLNVGAKDATRALELARENAQPEGSAIYFGVDFDPTDGDTKNYRKNVNLNLRNVETYFTNIEKTFAGNRYKVEVYGSGLVYDNLMHRDVPLAELCWLSPSHYLGTAKRIKNKDYDLLQKYPKEHCGGRDVDFNLTQKPDAKYGQF